MAQLRNEDVQWCVRRLPPALKQLAEAPTILTILVAGGFIRSIITGEGVNDVDVFTSSSTDAREIAWRLDSDTSHVVETPNAITVRSTSPVTQIIHRWTFSGPTALVDCIESFDFTIARAGIQYVNGAWTSYCDDDFYPDLAAKRLRYRHPDRREDEAGSMLRLLKFYRKGYRAPLLDIAGVVARAVKGMSGGDLADDELVRRDFIMARLRVVDPAVDPEQEGHLG